jgi:hypothetical protein
MADGSDPHYEPDGSGLCKCMDLMKGYNPNRDPQHCPRCGLPRWRDLGTVYLPGCDACGSKNMIVHYPNCPTQQQKVSG